MCVRSLVSMVSRRHTHLCCMNRDKDTLDMYLHIHIYIYMYTCTHVLTKTDVRIKRMPRERERETDRERERARERERERQSLLKFMPSAVYVRLRRSQATSHSLRGSSRGIGRPPRRPWKGQSFLLTLQRMLNPKTLSPRSDFR